MTMTMTHDQETALDRHNQIRARIGVQPLKWSNELTQGAQVWANYLANTDLGIARAFLRPRSTDEGEYIVVFTDLPHDVAPLTETTRIAYRQKRNWHVGVVTRRCERKCRHGMYTQGTTHVGMASAEGSNGKTYVVARYWPVGNLRGRAPMEEESE